MRRDLEVETVLVILNLGIIIVILLNHIINTISIIGVIIISILKTQLCPGRGKILHPSNVDKEKCMEYVAIIIMMIDDDDFHDHDNHDVHGQVREEGGAVCDREQVGQASSH